MEGIGTGIADRTLGGPTGIGGWLLVFLVWAALAAAAGLFVGVTAFRDNEAAEQVDTISAIAFLTTAALLIADIILILLRKQVARTIALITCGLLVGFNALAITLTIAGLME